MRLCFVVLLIVHTAYTLTSIQVPKPFIQLGKTDFNIRCLVNGSENERISVIQLIRSGTNIVFVSKSGVVWQDQELEKRAVANGSVMNATSSYLHMAIVRQNVTKNDGGTYSCKSSDKYGINEDSQEAFLNITESKENDTNDACGYKPSQHSFLLVLLALLIIYKGM